MMLHFSTEKSGKVKHHPPNSKTSSELRYNNSIRDKKLKHTGITPTQGTDIDHDKTKVVQVQVTTRKQKGETRKSLDRNEEPRTATDLSE